MQNLPDIVKDVVENLRSDSRFLINMAGIYPGDSDGKICQDAFLFDVMADTLENVDYQDRLTAFERDMKVDIHVSQEAHELARDVYGTVCKKLAPVD